MNDDKTKKSDQGKKPRIRIQKLELSGKYILFPEDRSWRLDVTEIIKQEAKKLAFQKSNK